MLIATCTYDTIQLENEDNLHKLAVKSKVTDMSKNVWKWNIPDIWLRSHSKMLHFMC